jgi:hypothetical protein
MIDNPMGQAAVAYHLAQLHLEAEEARIARRTRLADRPATVTEAARRRSTRRLIGSFLVRVAVLTHRSGSRPAEG